jgi:general secretion pathway protein K
MRRTSQQRSRPRRRQRGAALVVALFIVAIVVMLGTTLSNDFLLMFRRVENQLYSEQAYGYLLGAESLARAVLLQDLETDGQERNDNLAEPWAQEQMFPTDYGSIGGRIEDAQGRFNVNSLIGTQAGGHAGADYTAPQEHFIRLLRSLPLKDPLPLEEAQALTESIADWIDTDDEVSGLGGAESQYYAQADPPGKPANRSLVSPSELMWVKGMTAEIYRALAPLITVWPNGASATGAPAGFNINTAPPALLYCLGAQKNFDPLSESDVGSLVKYREEHQRIGDKAELAAVLPGKNLDSTLLLLSSDYFLLNSETEFLGHRYSLHSLLHRDGDKKVLLIEGRTFGEW